MKLTGWMPLINGKGLPMKLFDTEKEAIDFAVKACKSSSGVDISAEFIDDPEISLRDMESMFVKVEP